MTATNLKTKSTEKKKSKLTPLAVREERAAYLFLLPWILGVLFFLLGPILASFALSFTKWNLFSPPEFVGLANYQKMFQDRDFYNSMGVTLKYMLLSIPLFSAAALGLSVLLNQKLRGMYLFRTVMFMPSVLAGTAVAVMFSMLLQPDAGIINQLLRGIGIANPPRWLMSEQWAIPAVVLMGLWGIGGGTIIYLAGLQNIPPTLYEAADIDGASSWQKFFRITIPLLTPTIFFQLITSLAAAFQIFDVAFVLSGRGTRRGALMFYLLNIYNESFRENRFGYASALAWVLVLISAVTIIIINATSNRWVYYETESKGDN